MKPDIHTFLHKLASVAAKETLPLFRNLNGVESKNLSTFDPVTEADRNAEAAIRKAIIEQFPDDGIIGEEFEHHNSNAERCWIIDPIDGTKSFVAGIPLWGTLIGLCEDEKPVAGIMSQPFTQETFISSNGSAFYERGKICTPLHTSQIDEIENAILMSTAPDLFSKDQAGRFQCLASQSRMVRYGTDCYAYCMLAAGQIHLVAEAGLSFHDIAALLPIIESAGGIISDWDGNPFQKSGEILVASNVSLHQKALKALN